MSRIWITGSSGVGKTTLARTLAGRLRVPHVELDGLHHGPNWTPAEPEQFRAAVRRATAGPGWVVDGNYGSLLGTLVAQRADLRIALDLPSRRTMSRVIIRTLRRTVGREELWNGNTEPLSNLIRWNDPHQNVILWAWTERAAYHRKAVEAEAAGRAGGLPCVRLTSPGQVRRFVAYLAG
ncbi:AAA family ATPase [Nakamurella lactea]|uniref:AAA family ATPase n=1 Tax=Nakamurella lactea TaxID=459515 RepID=UPI00040DFA3E|nr:AAA family ATPase [Nakamurella lactea]